MRYTVMIVFYFSGNSLAQDVEGSNYEIVFIKDTCNSKVFFNKNFPDLGGNPFAPSINDFNIGFRLTDLSNVKLEILFVNGEFSYNIVKIDTVLSKGCYSVEWVQNYEKLSNGYYFYNLEIIVNESANDIYKFKDIRHFHR